MKQESSIKKRIIVIGGGLSGLSAAEEIIKKLPATEITVLQAMDEVGGRTLSCQINGAMFDLGGTWIGKTQKHAQKLAERAHNQLLPQFHKGTKVLDIQNKVSYSRSNIPYDVGILGLIHMQFNMWKLDRMAKKIDPINPRNSQLSFKWDSQTVKSWIDRNIYFIKVKALIECAIRAVLGAQTDEVSFLFFLWYIRQNGGIENLINIQNGLQEKKMKRGAQFLSLFLRQQVQKKGGIIKTKCFVKKIIKQGEVYIVVDSSGNLYQADYIIIAMPPARVHRIEFEPQLSRERRFICERNLMGSCSKVLLLYSQAFWKEKGYSGQTLSDCLQTPIFNAYDDCRHKQNGQFQPAIIVFLNASVDREWSKNREASQKKIVSTLANYFKSDKMLNPISIHWKVWNEQKSINGAPIAFFPPGVLTKIDDLRAPEGKIHWAGTQMATESQGFMDGAIQSGVRAAKQVVTAIQNETKKQVSEKKETFSMPTSKWYKNIINTPKKWFEWL